MLRKQLSDMIFVLIFSIISSVFQLASASTFEFLTFEYPPLIKTDHTGIAQRIIDAAARDQGIDATCIVRPRKRAIKMFQEKDGYIFLGEKRYFPDLQSEVSSQKLLNLRVVLVYLKDRYPGFSMTSLSEMRGSRIGLSLGSNLTFSFERADWQVEETSDLEKNLKKLHLGRIDFWGTVDMTAIDLIRQQLPDQLSRFGFWELETFPAEMVVKKNSSVGQSFKQLTIGLKNIVANGQYQEILQDFYGVGKVPASVMIK